jgi:hypothetical protein
MSSKNDDFEKDPKFIQYFKNKYETQSVKKERRNLRVEDLDSRDVNFFNKLLNKKGKRK